MPLADGRAWIINCNRCDEPIIQALCEGIKVYLSRFSVPLSHARVLSRYGRLVFNVWKGPAGLWVAYWAPDYKGRPDKGRLYSQHFCLSRK